MKKIKIEVVERPGQTRSRAGRMMQLGQRLRVAHCELYCIRTLLRGRR